MKKMLLICGARLAFSAATALAQTTTPGLELNWNQCLGTGAVSLKTSLCTTTANYTLVASYVTSHAVPVFGADEMFINFILPGGTSGPSWWGTTCTGRGTPFAANFVGPTDGICADF